MDPATVIDDGPISSCPKERGSIEATPADVPGCPVDAHGDGGAGRVRLSPAPEAVPGCPVNTHGKFISPISSTLCTPCPANSLPRIVGVAVTVVVKEVGTGRGKCIPWPSGCNRVHFAVLGLLSTTQEQNVGLYGAICSGEETTPAEGESCAETGCDGPLGDNADLNLLSSDRTRDTLAILGLFFPAESP